MLTPAQIQALARAKEILREHFDGSVIVARAAHEKDDESIERIEVTYSGGWSAAIGSLDIALRRMHEVDEGKRELE